METIAPTPSPDLQDQTKPVTRPRTSKCTFQEAQEDEDADGIPLGGCGVKSGYNASDLAHPWCKTIKPGTKIALFCLRIPSQYTYYTQHNTYTTPGTIHTPRPAQYITIHIPYSADTYITPSSSSCWACARRSGLIAPSIGEDLS